MHSNCQALSKKEAGLVNKLKQGAKIALSGRRFMDDVEWAMFTISEAGLTLKPCIRREEFVKYVWPRAGKIAGQHPKNTCRQSVWAGEQHGGRSGRTLATSTRIGTTLEGESVLAAVEAVYERNRSTLGSSTLKRDTSSQLSVSK